VTRNAQWRASGAEAAPSLAAALSMASGASKVFVIGGGELYAQAMAHADELVLTEIDAVFDRADAYFPPFDQVGFVESSREEHRSADATRFAFVTYRRKP
jgi:dihydrofolate reductase